MLDPTEEKCVQSTVRSPPVYGIDVEIRPCTVGERVRSEEDQPVLEEIQLLRGPVEGDETGEKDRDECDGQQAFGVPQKLSAGDDRGQSQPRADGHLGRSACPPEQQRRTETDAGQARAHVRHPPRLEGGRQNSSEEERRRWDDDHENSDFEVGRLLDVER